MWPTPDNSAPAGQRLDVHEGDGRERQKHGERHESFRPAHSYSRGQTVTAWIAVSSVLSDVGESVLVVQDDTEE
jgi:hypothetical protein